MRQLFGVVDADACVRGGPMSIAVSLRVSDYPFSANITRNLVPMADACGLFPALWHPESLAADPTGEYALAYDLIGPLEAGLAQLHGIRRSPTTTCSRRSTTSSTSDRSGRDGGAGRSPSGSVAVAACPGTTT